METITSLITTLGFPIAVCVVLFWYIYKTQQKSTEQVMELGATVKELTQMVNSNNELLVRVVENNTAMLDKVDDRLIKIETTLSLKDGESK